MENDLCSCAQDADQTACSCQKATSFAGPSKIVLHHLNNSRSQRILWLLEELEIPYELKKYQRNAQRRAPKELFDVNPLGRSPVITDGDVTIAESGAIVEYLIRRYGIGANVPDDKWVDNIYFTHYAEGSLQPHLANRLLYQLIPKRSPLILRPLVGSIFKQVDSTLVEPELKRHGKFIEDHLTKTKGWFAGGPNITSADYMMSYGLETFIARAPEHAGPKMIEYVKKVQARPAYKRALEKGGEYHYELHD
ncbi:Glutathione S-transferase 3 [Hypsizygus marmoreus]|uniref:glutathione transferase n=1 Tax=Hypsizygus marmoreus TaxID=39966 RepID=A0A369J358_HYPMA|nr:Glutathione S-transferase 3 [Hypsizygus marmoreus]